MFLDEFDPSDIAYLTEKSIMDEIVYDGIFGIEDEVKRTHAIVALEQRAEELRKKTAVAKLLKSYYKKYGERQAPVLSLDNVTRFAQCPYPQMKCGKWDATDNGINCGSDTACPHPLIPVERLYNIETGTEKVKIAFYRDGRWREVVVDAGTVSSQTAIVSLSSRGILVNSGNAKHLVHYIGDVLSLNQIPIVSAVSRLGWVDSDFVPYCGKYAYDGDDDYRAIFDAVTEHGEADVWKAYARDCCLYSNECRFMLAASCASVLVKLLGINSFVVHFWGGTGVGKTVGLVMAASVWGNPAQGALLQSLNATKVGLERKMAFLHDIPMFGDELQIIKEKFDNYDQLIMYLTEGSGRSRGTASGGIERTLTWNNVLISNGEEPITQPMSGGGAKNRCLEVQCEKPMFMDAHQAANTFREHYGFLGKEFLAAINDGRLRDSYNGYFKEMLKKDTTDKQAMAMAAVITADQYMAEVLGLEPNNIDGMARHMMRKSEVDVTVRAYEWVCNWIAEHEEKFQKYANPCWGRVEALEGHILVNRSVLEREMSAAGFSLNACLSKWDERKLFIRGHDNKFRTWARINGVGTTCIKFVAPCATEVQQKVQQ